jgi:hypothetical protein
MTDDKIYLTESLISITIFLHSPNNKLIFHVKTANVECEDIHVIFSFGILIF